MIVFPFSGSWSDAGSRHAVADLTPPDCAGNGGSGTCGSETFLLSENQSTSIPLGEVHRLRNPGKTDLELIEVQSGGYLEEGDIVRFDDAFWRVLPLDLAKKAA